MGEDSELCIEQNKAPVFGAIQISVGGGTPEEGLTKT